MDTGIYSKILKNAKVTPVYKSGERFLASNFRPISVLPTLTKLIEKHVSKHIYQYLIKFDLLHPTQSLLSNCSYKYNWQTVARND